VNGGGGCFFALRRSRHLAVSWTFLHHFPIQPDKCGRRWSCVGVCWYTTHKEERHMRAHNRADTCKHTTGQTHASTQRRQADTCEHKRKADICEHTRRADTCEHTRKADTCEHTGRADTCEHTRRADTCKHTRRADTCKHTRKADTCEENTCANCSIREHIRHT
jgi:hypothetical protein